MAGDIVAALTDTSRLLAVTGDFDEPDDPSQKRGRYFSHVIEVTIA